MEQKENILDKELSLIVVLPGGVEKVTVVHGSKPVMDLLVSLCAKYHLNPSSHTLELATGNRNNMKLKPSVLIGTLNAEKILLKPKGDDKNKWAGPRTSVPEATVRMVINYKKTQKTILRVNPRMPLVELLPAICEKCEFDIETTVLLRDAHSLDPLDLSCSLNDYAIREVYAKNIPPPYSPDCPDSPASAGTVTPGKNKNQKEKENKGLFSMFRKSKKKPEQSTTASAPASPVLVSKPRPLSMALPCSNSSPFGSSTISIDTPKKRRAPQPPIVVSQRCNSDLGTRRRIHSEPNYRLDTDQIGGVSRGSSAESSLKRTKRKAPPPPSPSSTVEEPVFPEETLQVTAAAKTLEEIMEQEETATVSVRSAVAGSTQGEDSSLNLSPEVSLHSPSPDIETGSTMSIEGSGEDQSVDLSSDGNKLLNASTNSTSVGIRNGGDPEEEKVMENGGFPVKDSKYEDSVSCCPDGGSGLLSVGTQDAELQTSVSANTQTLRELKDGLESSVTSRTSCPSGEDAEVQTDFTRLPPPPEEFMDKMSSSAESVTIQAVQKTDMGTLTEELEPSDLKLVPFPTSETQDSTPSAPVATKVSSVYATNSEPKPKPSNELTRDYIPKVGMTTYTVCPQKSLEKLRYFEVELTLETPSEASAERLDICPLDLEERAGQTGPEEISPEKSEKNFESSTEDFSTSKTTTTTTTTPTNNTVHVSTPEPAQSPSTTSSHNVDKILLNGASQAVSPTEVKEMKIPPTTKPKPASFRLAQHKKTPGYYVTSAAEKSLNSCPSSPLMEFEGNVESKDFPSPPPPVQCQVETAGATNVQLSPKQDDKNVTFTQLTRQSSLPAREPSGRLSLEKLRSFAAPRPFSPTTPSRFAQAVCSAVKRSQSLSHGPKSPSFNVSPITRHSSVMESKGVTKLKDLKDEEVDADDPILHEEETV